MGKLYLYTAFHTNLLYSSIPEEDEGIVIERCYWPLLRMAEELGAPIGIEFSGFTLERIASRDSALLKTLKRLWKQGLVEVIGSSYTQAIFPLIPAEANRANLNQGNAVYRNLLGRVPTVAYVNEQAWSRGLVDVYLEAGYTAILMDWNNPAKFNRYPEETQYQPQRLAGSSGKRLRLLWNHSISFQKFQRYVFGEQSLEDELAYLRERVPSTGERSFLLYGSDVEILDYTPGKRPAKTNAGTIMARIRELLAALKRHDAMEVVSPSAVLERFPGGQVLDLASPEYPIPCKKQEKYNLTRWAVTGQEDTVQNTTVTKLYRRIQDLNFFIEQGILKAAEAEQRALEQAVSYLWASDFRTYASSRKLGNFNRLARASLQRADDLLRKATAALPRDVITIFNPNGTPWPGEPFEFLVTFEQGRFPSGSLPEIVIDGKKVVAQFDQIERYQDGSLHRTLVVIEPTIPASGNVLLEFRRQSGVRYADELTPYRTKDELKTENVHLQLLRIKGASIKALSFPKISPDPLVGHIPHGFYDDITLSPEWFTGDVVLVAPDGKQLTDLQPAEITTFDPAAFPIRVPVEVQVPVEFGKLRKRYLVYHQHPRVDVYFQMVLNYIQPRSLHVGIAAFLPESFDRPTLHYATVNGGDTIERFPFAGHAIKQDEPVRMLVSTKHCLGETEGWVDVSDQHKGLSVLSWKDRLYSVPLLHYEETDSHGFFLRLIPTVSESDDVAGPTWWGPLEKRLSYVGHTGPVDEKIRGSFKRLERGLIVVAR